MTSSDLAEKNLALVHSCAKRFKNKGIEYDELFQAGCLGLVKAANGFDEKLGFKFSTYAVPVILGEIKRLFRDFGTVKVSRSMKEKSRQLMKIKEEIESKTGREASISEIAEASGIDEFEAAQLINVSLPVLSLTLCDDEGEHQQDIKVDSEEEAIQNILTLRSLLSKLSEEERKIIFLRYYKGLTQSQVAEKTGISQVQVSRKEKKIINKLRNSAFE